MTDADPSELVADLEAAAAELDAAREALAAVGEDDARRTRAALSEARRLLDAYENRATGTGDFQAYVEFRQEFDDHVESLDDDLPRREAFEAAREHVDQRRLSGSDFRAAREALEPAADVVALLDDRDEAAGRYRDAWRAVAAARDDRTDRAEELQRLLELGEADLTAPVAELEEPIDAYNDAVREAFRSFKRAEPARTVLGLVADTRAYPLASFREPPADLLGYVREHDAGREPIPELLEYADYSRSKLSHYVEDVGALKRAVGSNRTYLERLDAEPLTVAWPPRPAGELRWRSRELVRVVGKFADGATVERLRTVADFAREESRYRRLRESAVARSELDEDERERLLAGDVEPELRRVREERDRLADALAEHPEP